MHIAGRSGHPKVPSLHHPASGVLACRERLCFRILLVRREGIGVEGTVHWHLHRASLCPFLLWAPRFYQVFFCLHFLVCDATGKSWALKVILDASSHLFRPIFDLVPSFEPLIIAIAQRDYGRAATLLGSKLEGSLAFAESDGISGPFYLPFYSIKFCKGARSSQSPHLTSYSETQPEISQRDSSLTSVTASSAHAPANLD